VIDLLPDRKAETVAQWLQNHPNIEVVARDRSPDYINGIRAGAPQALQVADRWHLLLNLSQMVERFLGTIHANLRQLPMAEQYKQTLQAQRATFQRTKTEHQLSKLNRDCRVARYEQVQQWRREGYNITQIARRLNCKWETARDYFYPTEFPERQPRSTSTSIIDPFVPYLEKRLAEGCENASQLWLEIQHLGYPGSYKPVVRWIQQRRTRPASTGPRIDRRKKQSPANASPPRLPSSKQLAWVMVKDPEQLTDTERLSLDHIQQESAVIEVYGLAQQFVVMIKQRQVEQLDPWLTACAVAGIRQVQSFARGIRQDYDAVRAALATAWSNGQTEGQVNRLKFIKRQMYGRARFDLLRLRVLRPP
jgi:transposase